MIPILSNNSSWNRVLRIVSIGIFLIITGASFAQPGRDGAVTITSANTVVNCYSPVTNDVIAGTSSVTVNNSGGNNCNWQCGELVMLVQMQGASINTSNTTSYGDITNYNNCGLYEFNYVAAYNGNTVIVQNPWTNNYTGTGRVQLVKVPSYSSLTINAGASIVPMPWQDGGSFRKGGVVAIHCTGTVTVNGTISASAFGFRPGPTEQQTTSAGAGIALDYVANNANQGGEKGESIAGWGAEYTTGRYGRGAPANGGGGGNGHNAGGGGGSNASNGNVYNGNGVMCTACPGTGAWLLDPFVVANGGVLANSSGGGRGGYTYGASNQNALVVGPQNAAWGGDYRDPVGGFGGRPLAIVPTTRIFLGGGGGAGDSNNNSNLEGGKGGGIVYVIATNITGTGSIQSNGGDALNQIASGTGVNNDAPSGGGGGGTIIIKGTVSNTLALNARGGKGGDQRNITNESEGPGGGGGGGYVAFSAGTPTTSVAGGANGISLSTAVTEFVENGSTSGGSGAIGSVPNTFITYTVTDITASVNSPICAGGTINFTSTPTTPGGTFAWTGPNGFTSTSANPTITGATTAHSGNYQVVYITPGGCADTFLLNVIVRPLPIIALTPTQPTCNATCNGSIALTFTTSTTAPYTYAWSNGQTTQNLSNLCAGNYSVTVTDAFTCTATGNATIVAPPLLTASLVSTNATCNNVCNGSITVTAGGGTPTYSYSLNGGAGQALNSFTSLCDGNYNVVVTDSKGCTVNLSSTITEPAPLVLNTVSTVSTTCGVNNGALTVAASGGTTAYTYTLNAVSQPGGTFTNLAPGTYNVVVTDFNGCTANTSITIGSAITPTASILVNNPVSCFGGANGSVLIGVTGGSSPFTFSLNGGPGQASNLFSNLPAGNYTAQVTDANNCIATIPFTISQPVQLSFTTSMTPITCFGLCNGQIAVNASGGTAPYQYSSDNGLTFSLTNPMTNLCVGPVDIVVKDNNGCLTNATVNMTQPPVLSATFVTTDPVCNGSCDGTITVNASGGTPGYTYQLNNLPSQATPLISNVCAGNQVVHVTDANGCLVNITPILTNPPAIVISQVSMTESNCGFNNGEMVVDASGPNPPFQFSMDNGPFQSSGTFSNIFAGSYTIVAQDALGCTDTTFLGVNDIEMDGILISLSDPLCFGSFDGTVEVTNVNGAAPITFELDNSGLTQATGLFSSLNAGPHLVTIYDAGFCVFTIPINLNQPDPITFDPVVTDIACYGQTTGEINITNTAGGTAPYQYSYDGGNNFVSSTSSSNLGIGFYDIVILDDHGCFEFGQVEIIQSQPILISNNTFDLTCFQNATGFIQLGASGGNGGFQYSLNGSPFSGNASFVSLDAGTYTATVMDQEGCLQDTTVTLIEPTDLSLTGLATNVLCLSACDGTITGTGAGGTPGYIFSVDGGIIFNATGFFDQQCAGAYEILIQDLNGCQDSTNVLIDSPILMTSTVTMQASTCGFANGQITLNATGGSGTYQYSINNGANFYPTNVFTGLLQGPYQLVVQDGNGCTYDTLVNLMDMPAPVVSFVTTVQPTCFEVCNGSATVSANGGTGSIQYSLDGGANQPSNNFTNLCDGNHEIIVSDVNGCTDTLNFIINQPDSLIFTLVGTDLTCFQNNSGAIQVTPQGGTTPYNYSFNNGGTFGAVNTAQFLSASTFIVHVSDANNCLAIDTITLTEPTPVTLNLATVDPTCFGECNGSVTATASGGTPSSYTYLFNGVNTGSNTNINLCEGNYTVSVIDGNGCELDSVYVITNPTMFVIDSLNGTDVTCNTYCDGAITVYAPNAVQYSIDNGITYTATNVFSNLCAGDYLVQAQNAAGCKFNSSISIEEPLPVMLFSTLDSVMCVGDTIPLYALALGGTSPYVYTWSNGYVGQSQDIIQNTPGMYNVAVVDSHGCTNSAPNTINLTMLPVLGLSLVSDTFICQGTQVTLQVDVLAGTAPYSFSWNTGNANDTLDQITVLPVVPTTYVVTVTDVCSIGTDTAQVSFYTVPTPQFNSSNASGCSPHTVDFSNDLSISNLVNCSWEFENGPTINGCGSLSATFVNPGCYDVNFSATTADGCPVNAQFTSVVCVYENPVASFSYNPSQPTAIENNVQFNNTTYGGDTYVWNFGPYGTSSNEDPMVQFTNINPDDQVNVCLVATSINGCQDSVCKVITFLNDFLVWVPNTFTPDGDEFNNGFNPVFSSDKQISDYSLLIFNRWGELLFESHDPQTGWDGTYHEKFAEDGTYTWVIEVRDDLTSKKHKFIGHVNILR
jgi:gliding motility-associated-like protein